LPLAEHDNVVKAFPPDRTDRPFTIVASPAAASLTAATDTALMILRPPHSRVIMAAAITGRDSTARYSAMRGPTAAWRTMAQGGPHQEAMAISLSDLDCSLQMTRRAMKRVP